MFESRFLAGVLFRFEANLLMASFFGAAVVLGSTTVGPRYHDTRVQVVLYVCIQYD
jgi:hypothetical protein